MSFPASTITKQDAWSELCRLALRIKNKTEHLRNLSAAGDTYRTLYIDLQQSLDDVIERWAQLAATPGLEAYARDQIGDNSLNLTTAYTTMRTAAIALRDWINNNLPRDATTQAVLIYTVNAIGDRTELTFTTAQTAPFRTVADAFISTIS